MAAQQAQKRVGLTFVPFREVTWDHRKLGKVLVKGLDPSPAAKDAPAPTHPHQRQAARPGGQQAGAVLYGIEAMADAGIEEVGIIIAPETGGEIRRRPVTAPCFGLSIQYIEQDALSDWPTPCSPPSPFWARSRS